MTPSYVDLFVKAGRVKQIAITWWIFPFPIESSLIALNIFGPGEFASQKWELPKSFRKLNMILGNF